MGTGTARQLAEKPLAEALPRRWKHVQGVAAEAERLCAANAVDPTEVVAAAWLHDIGYSPRLVETGFHPLDGARHLRTNGWPSSICALVAHHTDAARHAGLPRLAHELCDEFGDLLGLSRDILWAADATTGPDGERLTLDERLAEIADRYGETHAVTARMRQSQENLAEAIARVESLG